MISLRSFRPTTVLSILLFLFLGLPCWPADTDPTPTGTPEATPTPAPTETPTPTPTPGCCERVGRPPDEKDARGFIACCRENGEWEMETCIVMPDSPWFWDDDKWGDRDSKEREIVYRCIHVHEQSEKDQGVIKCRKGPDGQYRGRYKNRQEERKADCAARKAQLDCLRRGRDGNEPEDCKGDLECKRIVGERIAADEADYNSKEKNCDEFEEEEEEESK